MPKDRAVKHLLPSLLLALVAPLAIAQADAGAVSADAAARAVAAGAVVVDVRAADAYARGHLPGAVSLPEAVQAEDRATLQQLVSRHGIDLSRDVLLVGQPGDPLTQALQARLVAYATGRVQWFVGGTHEWALSGRPLATQAAAARAPVPQHLVRLAADETRPRMAGAALRDVTVPAAMTTARIPSL